MRNIFIILFSFMAMIPCLSCAKDSVPTSDQEESGPVVLTDSGLYVTLAKAGTLDSLCTGIDCSAVTNLTLKGHIDARDFNCIKWNFTNVQNVNLAGCTIDAYSGKYGTNEGYEETYAAATIPEGAFFYWCNHYLREFPEEFFDEGMPSLQTVSLPAGIVGIERNAFARAYNLTEINIPEGVEHVDYVSFRYCVSLKHIDLPSTVKEIGLWAFTEMNALETVTCRALTPPSTNQSFGGIDDIEGARGWVNNGSYNADIKATLLVPAQSLDAYRSSEWATYFKTIKAIL